MTIIGRRALYLSFITVFVIAGTIILFYLQGYRIDIHNKWQIERTGAIQVNSYPKNANIILNDELFKNTTPATILSLKPGDYQLKLSLDGFQPWSKTVAVTAAEVTLSGDITLWPNTNTGTPLKVPKLNESWLSPNNENLLYVTKPTSGNELWLLNLKSGQTRLLARQANSEIISLEWSPSSRILLVQEKSGSNLTWRTFNLEESLWQDLYPPTGLNFTAMHWGEDRNLLYGTTGNELYEYNLRNQTNKLVWREKINDFRVNDKIVFALTRNSGESLGLKLLNLSNLQPATLPETPVLSTNLKFFNSHDGWLPLFDADRHTLYLLHSPLSGNETTKILPNVTTYNWGLDQNLVITNNFEIWLFNIADESPVFVERLSSTLTGALRYYTTPYVLFFSGPEVWAIELDNRGEKQRWLIGKFDEDVTNIFLSPDYKTLTVQTTADLYRLTIQTESNFFELPTD